MRPTVYASGFLIFRMTPRLEFLLMKHANRWDLPKGRLDFGETKKEAALRELQEETGIDATNVWVDPHFEFVSQYWVKYGAQDTAKLKELSIYLAVLQHPTELVHTEHLGHQWCLWDPPHKIQEQTIDPLLQQAANYIELNPDWPPC